MAAGAGASITNVNNAIIYADGSMETRNDAVVAEIKEEERLATEQHAKGVQYAGPSLSQSCQPHAAGRTDRWNYYARAAQFLVPASDFSECNYAWPIQVN